MIERLKVTWLTGPAWHLVSRAFPAYDIPVPRWALGGGFEGEMMDACREQGWPVHTVLRDGKLFLVGVQLKND